MNGEVCRVNPFESVLSGAVSRWTLGGSGEGGGSWVFTQALATEHIKSLFWLFLFLSKQMYLFFSSHLASPTPNLGTY